MHTALALLFAAQTTVDPIADSERLGNAIQKGGLGIACAILLAAVVYLSKSKDKVQLSRDADGKACALEIKELHATHAKAMTEAAERARTSDENKNTQIVGMVGKLVEVVTQNNVALERLTDAVERIDPKRS